MKKLYLTICLLTFFCCFESATTAEINPDSIEILTTYKINYRLRISGFQFPIHKDTQFCKEAKKDKAKYFFLVGCGQ